MICYQLKRFDDSRAAHKEEQEIIPAKGTALTHGRSTTLDCDTAVLMVLDGSRFASRQVTL